MSSNPFEMRLDIVRMAKDMLEREHDAKMMEYSNAVSVIQNGMATMSQNANWEADKATDTALTRLSTLKAPPAPTPEEVIARATTLYSFVENSSRTPRK